MRIFRWLVVVSVVIGAAIGSAVPYLVFFTPAYSVASSQLTGHSASAFISPLAFLALEIVALIVALLSGVMYSVSTRRGWQIALWGAAIVLLVQSALAFSSFVFIPLPGLPPAAALIFLAAMFSLGVRETTRDANVDRQPLIQPSSTPAPRPMPRPMPRPIRRLVLGAVVALLGGAAYIVLLPVSWLAFLIALGVSSIGATLLIRSPAAALVAPVGVWLGAIAANIAYGLRTHGSPTPSSGAGCSSSLAFSSSSP